MRDVAARSRTFTVDAKRYRDELAGLVRSLDDTLLEAPGIGPISAAKLVACDPARFKDEAAFARCNDTAPIPASSGKTVGYRLNRGGDRQVNNAIHTIAIIRAKHLRPGFAAPSRSPRLTVRSTRASIPSRPASIAGSTRPRSRPLACHQRPPSSRPADRSPCW
jgi:transposase